MYLMIPGPIAVDERIVAALNRPAMNPHGREHMEVLEDLFQALRALFQTESWVTAIGGSGRTGLEAAIASVIERGDATVHIINGSFGELMVDIAVRVGARVVSLPGRWGRPVDLGEVEEVVRRERPRLVTMVHSETSTGAVHDVASVSRISRRYEALFMVDAISSIGTIPFAMDEMDIDLAVSASNKGVGALHGMAMVGVSARGRQAMKARQTPCQSFALDLLRWEETYFHPPEGRRPRSAYPPPTHLVYALQLACRLALDEGLPARWARCRRMARATRAAVETAGLKVFPEPEVVGDSITAIVVPDGVDGDAVLRDMEAQGVLIAGTVGRPSPVSGKLWRVSHQGVQATEEMLIPTLSALERSLRAAGHAVAPGTMVSACQASLGD
jgi:(S)-ureidoglycine-glyoxylate aminotransferase